MGKVNDGDGYVDSAKLRQALNVLKPDGVLFEIRLLRKQGKGNQTRSGYFRSVDLAVECLEKFYLKGWNCFWTLNTIDNACYSRQQCDRITEPTETTSDDDVTAYEWLLIDFDPVRKTGISSTDEELKAAIVLSRKVYRFLHNNGWEDPVVAMSGNGIHLLYRVGMKNTPENVDLVKNVLAALDMLFSTDEVEIDTGNFNPSRICKLYGTLAQKGAGTKERPHRMSYLRYVPDEIRTVSKGYLQKIADALPKDEKPQAYNDYRPEKFDIVRWMDDHGLSYRAKSGKGYTKYVLDECPFNSNHKAPDSMITQSDSGKIGFRCLHNSCQDKHWQDVRIRYEPGAYDRRNDDLSDDGRINEGWKQHQLHNRDKAIDYDYPSLDTPVFLTAKNILQLPAETEDFVRTGISGIDNRMRGLKKGAVSLLSGLRGAAKSTLLSTLILNARQDDDNVICYSGELMPRNFMRWMFLQAAGKNHVKSTKWDGYYTVPDDDQMAIAEWLGERFLLYNNEYGNDYEQLYDRLKGQIEAQKTDLVILDNLMALDIRTLNNHDKYEAQKEFVISLVGLAKKTQAHILFVAHPRKSNGFLRLEDVSGTNDLVNAVDNAFIIHRNNEDFRRLSQEMFKWSSTDLIYMSTNVIEIAKDRDMGTQDVFVPLWYEKESKRLKNSVAEMIHYGWEPKDEYDGFEDATGDIDIPF